MRAHARDVLVSGKQKNTAGKAHLTATRAAIDERANLQSIEVQDNNSGSRTTGEESGERNVGAVAGGFLLARPLLSPPLLHSVGSAGGTDGGRNGMRGDQ